MADPLQELETLLSEGPMAARAREEKVFDTLSAEHPIVLFGAGNLGRRTLSGLRRAGIEPLALADNDPKKQGALLGLKVLSPREAADAHGRTAVFVVCIWNAAGSHRFAQTRRQLEDLGCTRIAPFVILYWKHPQELLPYLFWDLPHRMMASREALLRTMLLWSDETSKSEFVAHVRARAQGDLAALPEPLAGCDYSPPGVFRFLPDEVFVDCGAYTGDTIQELFLDARRGFAHVHALEPDPGTFGTLRQRVLGLPSEVRTRITLHELAASYGRHEARFAADGTEAAAFSSSGSITVSCAPLDEVLRDSAPTFIKMDIEGAEKDALRGASHLIRTHRPVLALCLYHCPGDLWEIPLLVDSIAPGYRFFLRSHLAEGFQHVCYAVPDHRLA
jgi:FkbM family methyltransferase